MKWMDRIAETLAEFAARNVSPRGGLAWIGCTAAGVRIITHLPVDRRSSQSHLHLFGKKRDTSGGAGRGARIPEGGPNFPPLPNPHGDDLRDVQVSCSDSKYCWIHGRPCACCGGSDTTCPAGTTKGSFWSYCCGNRLIFYYDCCGAVNCPANCPFCQNSSEPNWCGGAGGNRYVCTQAADKGAC